MVDEGTHGTFGRPRPSTKSAGFGAAGPKDKGRGRVAALGRGPPRRGPADRKSLSPALLLDVPSECWLAIGGPEAGPPNPLKGGAVQPLPPPPPQSRRRRATAPCGMKSLRKAGGRGFTPPTRFLGRCRQGWRERRRGERADGGEFGSGKVAERLSFLRHVGAARSPGAESGQGRTK